MIAGQVTFVNKKPSVSIGGLLGPPATAIDHNPQLLGKRENKRIEGASSAPVFTVEYDLRGCPDAEPALVDLAAVEALGRGLGRMIDRKMSGSTGLPPAKRASSITMKRTALFLIALFSPLMPTDHAEGAVKPNILVILTDDVGWGDFFFPGKRPWRISCRKRAFAPRCLARQASAVSTRRRRAAVGLVRWAVYGARRFRRAPARGNSQGVRGGMRLLSIP
jgi:hypothetical protein